MKQEMGKFNKNLFKLFLVICCKFLNVFSLDNFGLCADAECSVPVALGITTIRYHSPDQSFKLSFNANQEVLVYVKDYGEKKDLLGVEMNGRKGYIPKNFVRETKSIQRATVPANVEFLLTPTRSPVHHETSHLRMSSNIPSGDTQNAIHASLPNSFNSQQSMQAFHHSEVHLESSRNGDHSHFHASSEIYIAKNADSRNYFSQSEGISFQASHIDSSSHSHFESENTMAANFVPKGVIMSNSGDSFRSQPPEFHFQNPSSQYYSQSNNVHESDNRRQSFDSQSNSLQFSQGFDSQSNVLHHTHAPQTTPQLTTQSQMFSQGHVQSNVPPINNGLHQTQASHTTPQHVAQSHTQSNVKANNYDQGYDETMSLLLNQGYNSVGEPTNQLPNQHFSEQTTSYHNTHSDNVVWNRDVHIEKSPQHSEYTPSLMNSGQNNPNNPSSVLKMDDIKQIVENLFTEDISGTPSETVISQEASRFQSNERIAAKFDKISELAKTLNNKFGDQSINENKNDGEDDEDYVDYESKYSSKTIQTPLVVKSEQSNILSHEQFTTKSEVNHNMENMHTERESEVQNIDPSSSTILPSVTANEVFVNDTTTEFEALEMKNDPNREDTFIKKTGNILETNQGQETISKLNSISSVKIESNDGSSDSSLSEKLDLSQNKENISQIKTDSDVDKDFIFDSNENIVDVNNADDLKNGSGSDSFGLSDDNSKLDSLLNVSEIKETEDNLLNAYQTRHLKDVENGGDSFSSNEEAEQIESSLEFNIYVAVENTFVAIRVFVDSLLSWVPEPLFTMIMNLEKEGISPKVTVFTVISAIPCIVLILSLVFIKGKSKENKLNAKLTVLERNFYNVTAEKIILEEKLEKAEVELQISRGVVEEDKILSFKANSEFESLKQQLEGTTLELEKSVDELDAMKGREHKFVELIRDHEREHLKLVEEKGELLNKVLEYDDTFVTLRESLQEKDIEIKKLLAEKSEYRQANEIYEEKVNQLQKNCNQLLQEAEVWNLRVKELGENLCQESLKKEEMEKSMQEKDIEIESLSEAVQLFKAFEEIGDTGNDKCKTSEEKLKYLKNSTHNLMKLQKQEEENRLLSERLSEAKNRLLDIEVAIMDVKSENDKLKVNYNQALQDKAEALTKLEVLTNYFKDKEIQMQKQLGVQEAVRQKTEEDASSAERRICLIEQENSSYKYQVASMKQEIEETERNLKSQIALQEKKAHENWLAARTAERKLEDTKQEVMQLRQRLTLLEREQENWANSTRDEIIRPVPKRIGNMTDDSINTQDSNSSLELRPNVFPPPPPMMLPSDRPLPPLPPLPPFLPPGFEPPPPFPWNMPPPDPLSNSDFRMTPSDYGRLRESTPPRGRNSVLVDGELGPRQSSPITDMKDSRNSTPPHLLPDFHDIPPHPSRPFYPPPPMGPRTRYPMPPRFPPTNFRRDYPGQRRIGL